ACDQGKPEGIRTVKTYCYRVAKYIGAYTAAMNGVDAICFTAGIGENSAETRAEVCEYMGYLGIAIDGAQNAKRGEDVVISTPDSRVKVMVIPTNEELMIARETAALIE
nr:acetate kinase [Lachnospiraceae bacterium]